VWFYISQGVTALVSLANGLKFMGSECRNDNEALQSASSVALFQLVNMALDPILQRGFLAIGYSDLCFLFIVPVTYTHWQLLFDIKQVCQIQFHLKKITFRALALRQSELF